MKRLLITENILVAEMLKNLSASFDGSFYWSVNKSDDLEEVYYSDNVTQITGYSAHELVEMKGRGLELIVDEDIQNVKQSFHQLESSSPNEADITYRIKKKNGERIWINEKIKFNIDDNGAKIYKGIVSDVSEIIDREEMNHQRIEDLIEINRTKDNFISILSHDLRAPFTSILGFTEILLAENQLTEPEKKEYLKYIHDSSANQLKLVTYLLDWSKLQSGKLILDHQRLNVQSLVFNCVSSLTGNAIRKNIDIKVRINNNLYIKGDERLIIQVVTNILSNAIKFSPEGKSIEIKAERYNHEMVEFIVKDEGVGITAYNQTRIFKFDKMFSTSGTKGERGTGLGLSLVKEIIEKHKGQIWFYSVVNEGSEFHFTIPGASNTILVIENQIDEYKIYEKAIGEKFPEYKVVGIDNGYEAINYIIKEHPSLIVSSNDIPLMSGLQLLKSIQKGNKNFRTPVIAILNRVDENLKDEFTSIGVKSFLSRPIDPEQLTELVSSVLN